MEANFVHPRIMERHIGRGHRRDPKKKEPVLYVHNPTLYEKIKGLFKFDKYYMLACLPGLLLLVYLIFMNTGTRLLVAEAEEVLSHKDTNVSCIWDYHVKGVMCTVKGMSELYSYTDKDGNYEVL